jgi:hypothetical protein
MQFIGQLILFLNLFEERIPLFVRAMDFAGLCFSLWKIWRLIEFVTKFPFFAPREEYRGETDDADAAGMTYLYWALTPMIIIYALYQLKYGKYTGLRSYVIHCASGAVYSFGFLAMFPQLFVNYKLKTVAGMSRAAFGYKFFSTFIDDLYTFLTDLPLMYKIACFRDDVIFAIWLVQCCMYPIDPTRPNEFGFVAKGQEEEEKAVAELMQVEDNVGDLRNVKKEENQSEDMESDNEEYSYFTEGEEEDQEIPARREPEEGRVHHRTPKNEDNL